MQNGRGGVSARSNPPPAPPPRGEGSPKLSDSPSTLRGGGWGEGNGTATMIARSCVEGNASEKEGRRESIVVAGRHGAACVLARKPPAAPRRRFLGLAGFPPGRCSFAPFVSRAPAASLSCQPLAVFFPWAFFPVSPFAGCVSCCIVVPSCFAWASCLAFSSSAAFCRANSARLCRLG
jgi:hypothetical protein